MGTLTSPHIFEHEEQEKYVFSNAYTCTFSHSLLKCTWQHISDRLVHIYVFLLHSVAITRLLSFPTRSATPRVPVELWSSLLIAVRSLGQIYYVAAALMLSASW